MKRGYAVLLLILLYIPLVFSASTQSSNYATNPVIDTSGGGQASSASYSTILALSQRAVGKTSSSGYFTSLGIFNSDISPLQLNILPDITTPVLSPVPANTSADISCYATPSDIENTTVNVEYLWYNGTQIAFGGNKTGLASGANQLITILGHGNTSRGEMWNCTVRTFDGLDYSGWKTAGINISNEVPTQDAPYITPPQPNVTSNLTCNWNNVHDNDGDPVVNITNWYRNNKSTVILYMPFEGNSNEANNATDYSGYGNNGTVFSASWNKTWGQVGGAYFFDGYGDYIVIKQNATLNPTFPAMTISAWVKPIGYVPSATNIWRPIIEGSGNLNSFTGYYLGFDGSGSNFLARFGNSTTWATASIPETYIPLNQWTLVACVFNSTHISIYLNGRYNTSAAHSLINISYGSYPVSVGTLSYLLGGDHVFNGTIDELKIYNYSVSSEQLYADYIAGASGHPSNMIVYKETQLDDQWVCEVTPNDGYSDGTAMNSSAVTVQNTPPTQDAPYITPPLPNVTSNLTCNWNNVHDNDGDPVVNITNWYRNNQSIMLLYMPFEGGSNASFTKDYAPYLASGKVTGAVFNSTGGFDGRGAYMFDGQNTTNITFSNTRMAFNPSRSFTLMAWIKPNQLSSSYQAVIAQQRSSYVFFGTSTNKVTLGLDDGFHTSTNSLTAGQWSHIAATYNGTTNKSIIYINGQEDSSGEVNNIDANGFAGISTWYIGIDVRFWNGFNGTIDEVRVYNSTLSAEQVRAIYENRTNIIVSNELYRYDSWNCEVTPNDGYQDGTTLNSSQVTIINSPPTHDAPYITPPQPNVTSNLTCNWNNVHDNDDDPVVNITNWYRNNQSIMALYLPFEGNANSANNATDYSGYGNNATVNGATYNRTGGKIGGAYQFDGVDDYISTGDYSWTSDDNFTISVWVKMNTVAGNQPFLGKSWPDYEYVFMSRDGGAALTWEYWGTADGGCEDWGVSLQANTWYNFVVVHNSATDEIRLYNQGLLEQSGCTTGSGYIDRAAPMEIGRSYPWVWATTGYFNGTIDEVRIYDKALSSEQIYQNYAAGLANHTPNTIAYTELELNDQWVCEVTPNDGYSDGETLNSSAVNVTNGPPVINLLSPTNGNITIISRNPVFIWNAIDMDNDPMNFTIWVDDNSDFSSPYISNVTNNQNFSTAKELSVDTLYYWKVQAFDQTYYVNSSTWNFTTLSWVDINFTTRSADFGSMLPNATKSTDSGVSPLVIQNNGNVLVNITGIYANASLWQAKPINTTYFMYKADNDTTEPNSFNWTRSITAWTNMSDRAQPSMLVAYLNYSDVNDNAELDLNITVPLSEPPGVRYISIFITAVQS